MGRHTSSRYFGLGPTLGLSADSWEQDKQAHQPSRQSYRKRPVYRDDGETLIFFLFLLFCIDFCQFLFCCRLLPWIFFCFFLHIVYTVVCSLLLFLLSYIVNMYNCLFFILWIIFFIFFFWPPHLGHPLFISLLVIIESLACRVSYPATWTLFAIRRIFLFFAGFFAVHHAWVLGCLAIIAYHRALFSFHTKYAQNFVVHWRCNVRFLFRLSRWLCLSKKRAVNIFV